MTRQRSSRSPATSRAAASRRGKLRIIGGDYRRRQLPIPDLPGLRPTPDRVRETLFNWLGQTLYGQRALDLFAGTGALGIEALSRGCREALFVERETKASAQLTANLASLGAHNAQVQTQDALRFLATEPTERFDLVFLDPPFHQDLAAPCCEALELGGWLADDALIYLEVEATLTPTVPSHWQLYRETRAGESSARLYRRQTPSTAQTALAAE